jgi:hypothetical protein
MGFDGLASNTPLQKVVDPVDVADAVGVRDAFKNDDGFAHHH